MTKTINLTIFGNLYEGVKFPNTGQFIDIQTIKAKLTEGHLETFKMFERDGLMATIFVETIATFNTMIPSLIKDLNVPGLLSLELDKIIELAYIYKDQYSPFFEKIMDALSDTKKDSEQVSKESPVSQAA